MAVAELVHAQHDLGLLPGWLTAGQFLSLNRDRQLFSSLIAASPQLVHIHGLWRSPTRIASRCIRAGLPLVVSPHGMLDSGALAISYRRKKLVWRLWERRALSSAKCLLSLCRSEAESVRAVLPDAPIAVIPNGVALPVELPDAARPTLSPIWSDDIPAGEPVLLFLGRFHSKKGLSSLLKAWQCANQEAARCGWWLALVGYGDGGELQRKVLAAQSRSELSRVRIYGPVFSQEKAAALTAASAFILPSYSEGLPMAALEAMAHQLPCLLSAACNLPEAFSVGAALPAEPDPDELAASLLRLFALSSADRAAMGQAGRTLVATRFCWSQVAQQTLELYRWILGGGDRPGFVELT